MTRTAKKSLSKKLVVVLMAALLALVLAMQVAYAPVFVPASGGGNAESSADGMNGVSVSYKASPSGLVEDERLNDTSVAEGVSGKRTPAPSKEVDVIIAMKGTPMMEYAAQNGISVAQALDTDGGQKNLQNLNYIRDLVVSDVSKYIIEKRYDYTTVMNAVSATVKYGDIAAIEGNKHVDKVILSETYLAPQAITENYVDVYETGIFNSEGIGFDGTGTVVAVVDTGTDYTHEVFDMELDQSTLAITKDDVARVAAGLTATSLSAAAGDAVDEDNLYLSSKLPFAYDYADSDYNVYPHEAHGTHVAGVIAGKSDTITGVAPGAQIATFKVFSDYTTGAETESILAALNDAVTLGVDAINMSLGTSCGFSREVDETYLNSVYDSINDAGICLVVAASNDASSAQSSTWGNTNLASNPDSGTVGSPGSYNAALTVASVSGVKTKYFISDGEEKYFAESRLVGKTDPNDFVAGMLGDKTEGEFEYVVIPGVGLPVNYNGFDVTGKIAMVRRGTSNFEEKVRVAASRGAIGVIVYNNVSGTISMSVGTQELIPSCFITMDLAESMVAAGSGTIRLSTSYLAGPFMSDFSSWGALPNLILAPDITAHGGEIYSAVPGGDQYDRMSGTSMAAPNLAGALVLVREYVKQFYDTDNATVAERRQMRDESYSRMMSTATIVKNEDGNPYSPRKQGAGIADISHSINTKAYLTVNGLNKPKLSLGDDAERTGVYELKFNLVNASANAVSYSLDQYVMTESMSSDDRTVAEKAYLFKDTVNTYKINQKVGRATLNGNIVSLSGYGEVEIIVKIELSAADKQYLDGLFINGMFVEGYVLLDSNNSDGIDLNIPYMAFYGDWSQAPMLDVTEYEVGASAVDDSVLEEDKLKPDVHATLPYSAFYSPYGADNLGYFGMGEFAYNIASGYTAPPTQEKFAALTSNSDGDYMLYMINAGLLRGAKRVDMEIRNSATGELIWSGVDYNARKSHSSGGDQTGGMVLIELDIRELDLPNNSKYTFNMTCYLDWKKDNSYITDYSDQIDNMDEYIYGNKNTFSFEFTIDNEMPELSGVAVKKTEVSSGVYTYELEMSLYDNHYVQGYSVYTYEDVETENGYERLIGTTSLADGVIPIDGELNSDNVSTLDITGYWDKIKANGGKLYVNIYDYAKNTSSFEVVITEDPDADNGDSMIVTPKEDLEISKKRNVRDDYTIKVYEQLDLGDLLNVTANINENTDLDPVYQENYWTKSLIWEVVSDDEIIDITQDGVVTGLKEGTATVKVRTPNTDVFDIEDTAHCLQFVINVSGTQEGGLRISGLDMSSTALTLERGETATITATVKPYNYTGDVKLEWSSTSTRNVSFEVSEDGMSVTVTAVRSGFARIQARVVGLDYTTGSCSVTVQQEFNVSDNIYLRSYTGRGGDWVNADGEVEHNVVEIPDDLGIAYIYPSAFYDNQYIRKVIIPEGVTQLMRGAFFNCSALEEVVLPESLETIEYLAFANCSNLSKINLGHVKSIGDSAFWGCALTELDLSSCTYIDKYAFVWNTELTSLDLSRVGIIGGGAFAHCDGLVTLTIPENTSMEYDDLYFSDEVDEDSRIDRGGAFAFCRGLKSVTIKSKTVGKHAFVGCFDLESVVFVNDVETIGENAFHSCIELKNVTFHGSVYEIDDGAFMFCQSLEEIRLPDGLTIMGSNVFYGCDDLASITVSSGALLDNIGNGSLGGAPVTEYVVEDGNKYLSSVDGVLYDRAQKKLLAYPNAKDVDSPNYTASFTVPSTVRTIGSAAFSGVSSLSEINLNQVEYIESEAFSDIRFSYNGSTYYVSVSAPNVKYIGDYAFAGAVIAAIPMSHNNTTHIGDYAFYMSYVQEYGGQNTPINRTLNIPRNLEYLGAYAFAGAIGTATSGEDIYISLPFTTVSFADSSITSVGEGAFSRLMYLQNVDFGRLTSLSDNMFANCAGYERVTVGEGEDEEVRENLVGLKSVTIPNTVKSLGNNVFGGCTLLESVTLEADITVIPMNAFADTAITSVDIPDSVVRIGYGAFAGSKLTSVDLNNVTDIGASAFAETPIAAVASDKVLRIGARAFDKCDLLVSAQFPHAEYVGDGAFNGCADLAAIDFASAVYVGNSAFEGCVSLGAVELAKAETVGARAFYGDTLVTSVTLPKLVSVGREAFAGTAVTALNLPATLAIVGDGAFLGANSLTAINVDPANAVFVTRDNGVLYRINDGGLYTLVSYPAAKSDVTSYDVYGQTIKIGAYAFNRNTALKTVTLPAFVQIIGMSAMSGMTGLETLNINSVNAPTLESYAHYVEQEPAAPDDGGSGDGGDDSVNPDDFEDENEFVDRREPVFTNIYDNFSFAFGDADKEQQLTINIPYNNLGYNSRIWRLYVGKNINVTAKLHATLGTLELIESIKEELAKPTHDLANVRRLVNLCNNMTTAQRHFVTGDYEYSQTNAQGDVVATIDEAYYTALLNGTNYRQLLNNILGGSGASSAIEDGEAMLGADQSRSNIAPIIVLAAVAACVVVALISSTLYAKRRNRK